MSKMIPSMPWRVGMILAFVLYIGVLLWLTLSSFGNRRAQPNWIPLRTIASDLWHLRRGFVINFLGNIVGFLPMGFVPSLLLRGVRLWHVVAWSFGVSLFIETAQLISGFRTADVDDLILNTLGGVLGYGLYRRFGRAWGGGS
jgi:glycopeptide antibiotics resistance protein